MITKNIQIPIYKGTLQLVKLGRKEDLNVAARKYKLKKDLSLYDGVTLHEEGSNTYTIILKKDPIISVMCHEAFHVLTYVFVNHDMLIYNNNDEDAAYFLEWIVSECIKFYK